LLDVDVLTREDLETLLDQAMHMEDLMDRPVKKVPALRGKLVQGGEHLRIVFQLGCVEVVIVNAFGEFSGGVLKALSPSFENFPLIEELYSKYKCHDTENKHNYYKRRCQFAHTFILCNRS